MFIKKKIYIMQSCCIVSRPKFHSTKCRSFVSGMAYILLRKVKSQDWLVPLDFRQPDEPKIYDTTAAACAACGLIEIAKTCTKYDVKNYLNAALKLLKAIDEKAADYTTDNDNLLNYGSEAYYPGRGEAGLNTAIIYGDYYYTEAVYKLKGFEPLFW